MEREGADPNRFQGMHLVEVVLVALMPRKTQSRLFLGQVIQFRLELEVSVFFQLVQLVQPLCLAEIHGSELDLSKTA